MKRKNKVVYLPNVLKTDNGEEVVKYKLKQYHNQGKVVKFKEEADNHHKVRISIQEKDVKNVLINGAVYFEFITNIGAVISTMRYVKTPKKEIPKKMNDKSFCYFIVEESKEFKDKKYKEKFIKENEESFELLISNQHPATLEKALSFPGIDKDIRAIIYRIMRRR